MLQERQHAGDELDRRKRAGLLATQLILIALAPWVLVSCTNIHCGTERKGGGPGGCEFDLSFTTSDNPAPPGSPEGTPSEPP